MREYDDDNIRLYTPVLQRVIILLAVIIAVPVVMWTITTMVRTYVAPPKAPTFQRITENQPADTASIAPPTVVAPAAVAGQAQTAVPPARLADASASDARTPLLDIKKPAVQPPMVPAPNPPQSATSVQPPAATMPAPQAPGAKVAAAQPMPAVSAKPLMAPAPAAPTMQPIPASATQVAANSPAPPPAAPSNIVWPNPNANTPPDVGSTSGDAANPAPSPPMIAAPSPPASSDTASDDLPPGEAISGRVPLPPRRPMLFAMVQTAIPLPRPRPADAPAATPGNPSEAPAPSYDPGLEPGHY